MKAFWIGPFALAVLAIAVPGRAQAPAGVPAGTTGVCNDGSYSTAPSKRGACAAHKGVKTWYVASAATAPSTGPAPAPAPAAPPAAAPAPVPTPTAAPAGPAPKSPTAATRTAAPGGGNGQVWVNTSSNVYHCPGDRSYGTTKAGQYMSEADAKAKGARPAYGKTCTR